MNIYLEKIAETKKKNDEPSKKAIAGAAVGTGLAASSTHDAYHNGDFTGRKTLYHGTTKKYANDIKRDGLKPKTRHGKSGIIDVVEDAGKKLDSNHLTFSHRSKGSARAYSQQARDLDGKSKADKKKYFENSVERMRSQRKATGNKKLDDGVVKLNVPTWKKKYKNQGNPELEKAKQGIGWALSDEATKRAVQKEMGDNVHTTKSDIGPKYIKGSGKYKANSAKEIGQYIKHNKGRFAGGVAKAGIAAAGAAYTGKLLKDKFSKKKD